MKWLSTPGPPRARSWTRLRGGFLGSSARCWVAALRESDSSPPCTGSKAAHPPWSAAPVRTRCWSGSAFRRLSPAWSADRNCRSSSAAPREWTSRWKELSERSCALKACKYPAALWGRWRLASETTGCECRHGGWPPCTPLQTGRSMGSWAALTEPGADTSAGTHSCSSAISHSCPHLLGRRTKELKQSPKRFVVLCWWKEQVFPWSQVQTLSLAFIKQFWAG